MEHTYTVCPNCLEPMGTSDVCEHCGFDASGYVVLPHHLVPGTLIKQRYQIGRVLGEGGFGITYAGRDTVLNLKIAIKEFYMAGYVNRNHEASPTVFATLGAHRDTFNKNKDKFLSEARVLARFYEEPGIVGVRDFCEENGTAYIIMDFLDGVTLKDYLEGNGRLAPAEAIRLLLPVIRSLQHVHADGVIHRDISPDNIMVLGDGRTKLLDFGAAREVSQTDIKSLSVILKPGYAPEEQYRSKGRQGPWTDVYALAATLYRCIVGQAPDDAMERMYRDQLPAPADTEAACPVAISQVIMKGVAVRQPDRYQDVGSFLQDLEAALASPEDASIAADAPVTRLEGARGVPASGQPGLNAAPGGHTVLADLPTGRTVLADQSAQGQENTEPAVSPARAEPKVEPAPQPEAASRPEPEPPDRTAAPKETGRTGQKKFPVAALVAAAAVVVLAVVFMVLPRGGGTAPDVAQVTSGAADPTATPFATNDTEVDNSATTAGVAVSGAQDSYNFRTVVLNGDTIELPAPFSAFADQGWVFEDESLEGTIVPAGYGTTVDVPIINEYGSLNIRLKNPTNSATPIEECIVFALEGWSNELNDNYMDEENNSFAMVLGGSVGGDFGEMKNAYPELASDGNAWESETNDYSLRVYVNDSSNSISAILISTALIPDNANTQSFSTEEPAVYSDATFQADYGLQGFALTVNGQTYEMPMTVRDFVDAGWKIERAPEYIPAYQYATIYMRLDVRTAMSFDVYNYTDSAIAPEYALPYGLTIGRTDELRDHNINDDSAGWAYDGVRLGQFGQSKSEVRQALENAGLTVVETYTDDLIAMKGQVVGARFVFGGNDQLILIGFGEGGEPVYSMNRYDYEAEK